MKIKLDDRYYISEEGHTFILKDVTVVIHRARRLKSGEISETEADGVLGYFGTLAQAVNRYIRMTLASKDQELSLEGYVKAYQAEVDRLLVLSPEMTIKYGGKK